MESTEEVQHFKKTNSDFDFIEQLNDDEQDIFHIEEENISKPTGSNISQKLDPRFQIGMKALLIGASNSGKTTLLIRFLSHMATFFRKDFDAVYYYSGLKSKEAYIRQKNKLRKSLKDKIKYLVIKNRLPKLSDLNNLHLKGYKVLM